jgi:hypothetical protein
MPGQHDAFRERVSLVEAHGVLYPMEVPVLLDLTGYVEE